MSAIIEHTVIVVVEKIEKKHVTLKVYSKLDGDIMPVANANPVKIRVGDDLHINQPIEIFGRREK